VSSGKGTFVGLESTGSLAIKSGDDINASIETNGLFTKKYVVNNFQDEITSTVQFTRIANVFNYQFEFTQIHRQLDFTNLTDDTDFSEYAINWFVNINSESDTEIFEVYNLYIRPTQITFKRRNLESNTQRYDNVTLFIEMIKKI
jgi:hypothetical protein